MRADNRDAQPAISDLTDFDTRSGGWFERAIFNHRIWVVSLCAIVTIILGWQLPELRLNANFERMIPTGHPFIKNFHAHEGDLAGQGNVVKIVVEHTDGSILNKDYLATLQHISDDVYLTSGVNRPYMVSLWTPTMRWRGITEVGLEEGPVIDSYYDGSPGSLTKLRLNIERSGEIGRVVAPDFRSSMLIVPLLEFDGDSGKRLDYGEFSKRLDDIRARYESGHIKIHIVGFAQLVGSLIHGLWQVLAFFAISIAIATVMVYWYTRCLRSTFIVMVCSLGAVIWLLGTLPLLHFELDPYTILVPFLVFAIGMSHGSQKMNGVMQDIGRGAHRLVAARYTFRRLFMAGFMALLCDAVGFAVLLIIDIGVIRQLAMIASIGVAFLIFTNLILLPVLLSFTGVNQDAAKRTLEDEQQDEGPKGRHVLWRTLDLFTRRRVAFATIVVAFLMGVFAWSVGRQMQVGDLDPGAPELRADSRYNRDNAYITTHYGNSNDVFIVMVKSPEGECLKYSLLEDIDNLQWRLRQLPGVTDVDSFSGMLGFLSSQFTEGIPQWISLVPNQALLNSMTKYVPRALVNQPCSVSMVRAFLTDHKAETLRRVVGEVEKFAAQHDSASGQFLLAAGAAGIEAATNSVVETANRDMLFWVYGAVIVLCFVAFRSWRAVLCAILPLVLTSLMSEALMVWLHIGVKVSTLPVIALGVGIGVDYALYVLSMLQVNLRNGMSLSEAYYRALKFTGRVVLLTGFTLAMGVGTWIFSPIKFQADMGILLAFMFLWNMVGALTLLPALACFLLTTRKEAPLEQRVSSVGPREQENSA